MTRPDQQSLWLFQNFYDDVQYRTHSITASSSPTGAEAYRVGTARRSAIDAWAPTTENSTHWVQVDCGIPRPAGPLLWIRFRCEFRPPFDCFRYAISS